MLNWQIARDLTAFVWNSEEFKERGRDFLEKKKLEKRRFWGLYRAKAKAKVIEWISD